MKVRFVEKSGNVKTGRIPVTTSPMSTCPDSCELKGKGCYAELGHTLIHWRKVGEQGVSWDSFMHRVKALSVGQLWRHNQAGDLAGDGVDIDLDKLEQLTEANEGRKGFTYTHYRGHNNYQKIKKANEGGFTINLSASRPEEVDELVELGVAPVVVIMPADFEGIAITEKGNKILACPAAVNKLSNCKECGVCQVSTRNTVIGFPAHGARKRIINETLSKVQEDGR